MPGYKKRRGPKGSKHANKGGNPEKDSKNIDPESEQAMMTEDRPEQVVEYGGAFASAIMASAATASAAAASSATVSIAAASAAAASTATVSIAAASAAAASAAAASAATDEDDDKKNAGKDEADKSGEPRKETTEDIIETLEALTEDITENPEALTEDSEALTDDEYLAQQAAAAEGGIEYASLLANESLESAYDTDGDDDVFLCGPYILKYPAGGAIPRQMPILNPKSAYNTSEDEDSEEEDCSSKKKIKMLSSDDNGSLQPSTNVETGACGGDLEIGKEVEASSEAKKGNPDPNQDSDENGQPIQAQMLDVRSDDSLAILGYPARGTRPHQMPILNPKSVYNTSEEEDSEPIASPSKKKIKMLSSDDNGSPQPSTNVDTGACGGNLEIGKEVESSSEANKGKPDPNPDSDENDQPTRAQMLDVRSGHFLAMPKPKKVKKNKRAYWKSSGTKSNRSPVSQSPIPKKKKLVRKKGNKHSQKRANPMTKESPSSSTKDAGTSSFTSTTGAIAYRCNREYATGDSSRSDDSSGNTAYSDFSDNSDIETPKRAEPPSDKNKVETEEDLSSNSKGRIDEQPEETEDASGMSSGVPPPLEKDKKNNQYPPGNSSETSMNLEAPQRSLESCATTSRVVKPSSQYPLGLTPMEEFLSPPVLPNLDQMESEPSHGVDELGESDWSIKGKKKTTEKGTQQDSPNVQNTKSRSTYISESSDYSLGFGSSDNSADDLPSCINISSSSESGGGWKSESVGGSKSEGEMTSSEEDSD